MARITNTQKAGLDFLDQMFFNELVVRRGMNTEDQQQLDTIITRVTQMTEKEYSGSEAEIIKHLVYYFLEVTLTDTYYGRGKAIPKGVKHLDLSKETIEAIDHYARNLQLAFMLSLTEQSTGFDASYALEIFEVVKDEFVGYSAIVRRDLAWRCFVSEFRDASLNSYCWLSASGVLPLTKNSPDRIRSNFDAEFMMRLTLMADYGMITHYLKVTLSNINTASAVLEHWKHDLKESAIDRLLNIQKVFNESSTKSSLHNIPMINIFDLNEKNRVQYFFEQWGKRKVRLRMHPGTLASWLGFLGAGLVEMQLVTEHHSTAKEKFENSVESDEISDLKVPAIFNTCDNRDTITEFVKQRLLEYGLQINSDTLYRVHSSMRKTTLPLLEIYCRMTRDSGVVMPATYDDTFYMSLFIHKDKMRTKNSSITCE